MSLRFTCTETYTYIFTATYYLPPVIHRFKLHIRNGIRSCIRIQTHIPIQLRSIIKIKRFSQCPSFTIRTILDLQLQYRIHKHKRLRKRK